MKWLFRWLKRNLRSEETPGDKRAEFYLHETWFENFKSDLDSWSRRNI